MSRNSPNAGAGKGRGGSAICPDCGKPFRKTSQTKCPKCRIETRECPNCGKEFTTSRGNVCCSNRCHMQRVTSDPEHQRKAAAASGAIAAVRRREERQTDWYYKQGGKHVHRVVAESVLGRPLAPGEIVHHEDLNKLNNHPSNLIVFPSQSVHATHHMNNHPGSPCDCPGVRLGEVTPS